MPYKMQQQNFKAQLLLQVHDELVFECPKSELNELRLLVKTEMEAAYSLRVPLTVDMGIGINWLEAH